MPKCRSCGADIRWEQSKNGKPVPISVATSETHFADCAQSKQWSGRHRGDPDSPGPLFESKA